jgi:hypothetical protein
MLLHWQITGTAFPSLGVSSRKLSIPLQPFLAASVRVGKETGASCETTFAQWEQHKRRFASVRKNDKASMPRCFAITLDLLR